MTLFIIWLAGFILTVLWALPHAREEFNERKPGPGEFKTPLGMVVAWASIWPIFWLLLLFTA